MKKFVLPMIIALFATIMFLHAPVSATPVYDYNVETMLDRIYSGNPKINFFNKEYYTYKGAQRCEVHYGDNKRDSLIRFRLGDNNVQRILISYIFKGRRDVKYSVINALESTVILATIFTTMGLSMDEVQSLMQANEGKEKVMGSDYVTANSYFHNRATVWCATVRRNITLDIEFKNFAFDYYIYSE